MPSGRSLRGRLAQPLSGFGSGWLWNHRVPKAVPRGKDPIVRHTILLVGGYECGHPLCQFDVAEHEIAGSGGVGLSQGEDEQSVWTLMQTRPRKRRPEGVAAQPFQTCSVAVPNDQGSMEVVPSVVGAEPRQSEWADNPALRSPRPRERLGRHARPQRPRERRRRRRHRRPLGRIRQRRSPGCVASLRPCAPCG
ncbi:MAG: hypothetical protein ACI855_003109 [Myxococcota bacterium]